MNDISYRIKRTEEEVLKVAMEEETEVEAAVVAEELIEEAIMIRKAKVLRKQEASERSQHIHS